MRRFIKGFRHREKGFTLIELLIVVAILGIIAAVVIPNVAGFMTAGNLNAANTEVMNVKTAATGYMAESGAWPADSSLLGDYLSSVPATTYTFNATTGLIDGVGSVGGTTDGTNWPGLTFVIADQEWVRTTGG